MTCLNWGGGGGGGGCVFFMCDGGRGAVYFSCAMRWGGGGGGCVFFMCDDMHGIHCTRETVVMHAQGPKEQSLGSLPMCVFNDP